MNKTHVAFALGIGAAIGAAAALLFAPQSGERTRRDLGKRLDDVSDFIEDAGDSLKEQAGRLGSEAQRVLQETTNKASNLITDVASTIADQAAAQTKAVKSMF
jgi:gas vesicle protein